MTIREAISTKASSLDAEYGFYLYHLDENELAKEQDEQRKAEAVLAVNNIGIEAIIKHVNRKKNVVPEPTRFIDRPHFIAIDIDNLPF